MKKIFLKVNLISMLFLLLHSTLYAETVPNSQLAYDTVYRTDRVADTYYFLLLSKNGMYYHLRTNKTENLTATELKSASLLDILNTKQEWGQTFPDKGQYTLKNDTIYTNLFWDEIKVLDSKKIKYLNKIFSVQQ
ncbi:MAG: hypothetical protein KU29_08185 [Sulfurovum sp. FS06-10]|nr:MAG: hypothetical protein KU29_08185 [Sulfurovum sp. FS06-10]